MADERDRRRYRMIARLLPREFHAPIADELERAAVACVASARRRRGRIGVVSAWLGLTADTVRTALEIRLGGRRRPTSDRWRADVRQGWRLLASGRGASLAIVVVLALGIGLMSSMFALTDPYVLRPLPYARPHELVFIEVDATGLTEGAPIPTVDAWRARTTLFAGLATYESQSTHRLRTDAGVVPFYVRHVSPEFFDVLGVPAPDPAWRIGGTLAGPHVVVTQRGLEHLREEDRRQGRLVSTLDGPPLRIAGTLPAQFLFPQAGANQFTDGLQAYAPGAVLTIGVTPSGRVSLDSRPKIIGRLQPGITPELVRDALSVPLPSGARLAVSVEPLADQMQADVRPLAVGTLVACVLILCICAGNVANLILARGVHRAREFAVRQALGASRWDVLRLRAIEHAMIAVVALTMGLALAWLALASIAQVVPDRYIALGAPVLSWRTVAFAGAAAAVVVLLSMFPAGIVSGFTGRGRLHRGGIDGPALRVTRFAVSAGQAALAMVLAVGAAMLVHSYANLFIQDTGYDEHAVSAVVRYGAGRETVSAAMVDATLDRLRRIPGVVTAGATESALYGASMSLRGVLVHGQRLTAHRRGVSVDYFEAAGIRVLRGRALAAQDRQRGIVVNEAFARQFWPTMESALGQLVVRSRESLTIVGVAKDVFDTRLDQRPEPTTYALLDVSEDPRSSITYVVRSRTPRAIRHADIRQAINAEAEASIETIGSLGDRLADTVRERTFAALILGMFGVAGVAVTVAGLVALVTFVVARRTREIAIRVAIGAQRRDIRWLVTRDAIVAATAGGLVGLLIGRWLSTWLKSLVYGIEAGNWMTALAAGALLLAIMTAAALLAARRAVRLPPTIALRVD